MMGPVARDNASNPSLGHIIANIIPNEKFIDAISSYSQIE
jgi:hypothetical protein